MTNSLVKFSLPSPGDIEIIKQYVRYAASTGHYKKLMAAGGEGALFLLMLTAREYDIPPLAALNGGLYIIDGKVEMASHMKVSKIRQAGHSMQVSYNKDNTECYVKGKRKDTGDEIIVSFSMEDARRAGLANKGPWQKFPKEMIYARAVSRISNMLFSDVMGGVTYAPGEIAEGVEVVEEPPISQNDINEYFFEMFLDEKDTFVEFVSERALQRNVSPEIMMSIMYKMKDKVQEAFEKWKNERFLASEEVNIEEDTESEEE